MRRARAPRRGGEPTIALINVVFLLLVFFLIAGQLSPPMDQDIELPSVKDLTPTQAPDALLITENGALLYKGQPTTLEVFWTQHPQALALEQQADSDDLPRLRIVPDRRVPAKQLLGISRSLRDLGAKDIWIVTQRGLEQES